MKRIYILFLIGLFAQCSSSDKKSDSSMNNIVLTDLSGNSVSLDLYKGKTVFINFWATWCKPCIMEMPTIATMMEKFKNDNIVFLFASNEDLNQIEKFEKKHSFGFHYVRVDNFEALNIQALPTTYIFNSQGELEFSEVGFRSWDSAQNIELISKIVNHE
ncbi:MAG: TlpA family protein disulfide reductase [Cyclobacteriaceae bacterium]|nr:TlpA family protein disulfide reductase [Cyclobacteriaceae bacterium]